MLEIKKGTEIQSRYVIGDHLGSGGFGIVWRATDKQLHRDVAIKRLTSQAGRHEHLVEEARRTVKLEARAELGDYTKALQDVEKALKLDPENHHAIRLRRKLRDGGAI